MVLQWILRLLVGMVALPILMCLLFGLGYLLTALGNGDAALVVSWINLAIAVVWIFDVLLLIIALAWSSLADDTVRGIEIEEIDTGAVDEQQ